MLFHCKPFSSSSALSDHLFTELSIIILTLLLLSMMDAVDHLSSLPDDIILCILSFLRVNHAVQTSVLSKRWRYLWTFNPNLCFPIYQDWGRRHNKDYGAAIDSCIKQYRAEKLQKLSIRLHVQAEDLSLRMKYWCDFAIDKKVEHLELINYFDLPRVIFKVPDCLFSSPWLQSLILYESELYLPSDIKCFDSLKTLWLYRVAAFDGAVESLLSKCRRLQKLVLETSFKSCNVNISLPQLQDLSINFGWEYHQLHINAPNLLFLEAEGRISEKLHIQNSPYLQKAVLLFKVDQKSYQMPCEHLHFWGKTLHNVANIKVLHLTSELLKMICTEYYFNDKRRLALYKIKQLHLECSEGLGFDIVYPLVRFLRDCPSLEGVYMNKYFSSKSKLNVKLNVKQLEAQLLDDDGKLTSECGDFFLDHLKEVKLTTFSGELKEMVLLKFLLEKATTLGMLRLGLPPRDQEQQELFLNYISWLMISPRAKIEVRDAYHSGISVA